MTTPATEGYRLPAEWQEHRRCWIAWPCRAETFGGALEPARVATAAVARAIAAFEPVTMVCRPDDAVEASVACGGQVTVAPLPISDSWVRDTGPSFLVGADTGCAGVHWRFNAWGGLFPDHGDDAALGRRLLEHQGLRVFEAPMVLEGGAIQTDGAGTLITTEECLLNPNRNPGLERAEIEAVLKAYTGVETVIWLGQGYEDDETSGHIDEIACFVRPGVVMLLGTDDPHDGNSARMRDNLERLRAARDAAGRTLEVVVVPQPARRDGRAGRLTLSYTNLYIANGGVVMPSFEDPADREAYRIVRRLFPGRKVVQVSAGDIVPGGGGIHCITLGQPA